MCERNSFLLGEVTSCHDSRRVPVKAADRTTGDYPYYGASGVVDHVGGYLFDGDYLLVAEDGDNLRTKKLPIAFLASGKFWVNNHAHVLSADENCDIRYLRYVLNHIDITGYLSGSTRPKLTRGALDRIRVELPSLKEQWAAVEVLGALEKKIVANERIIDVADQLAEARYAHASRGRDGWRDVPLGESAAWLSGGTPRTSEPSYWNGEIPWISAASLKMRWIDESDRKVTELGARNGTRLVPEGAIIFVVRGMSLTSEFRVGLTQRQVAFGQDCKALMPLGGIDPLTFFLAIVARSREVLEMVDTAGHGTGRLSSDRIAKLNVRVPEGMAAERFAAQVRPLAARSVESARENRTLAELRDTLLPKLISGQIRIKDAERAVEEAV